MCRKQEPISAKSKLSSRPSTCVLLATIVYIPSLLVWYALHPRKNQDSVHEEEGELESGLPHSTYTTMLFPAQGQVREEAFHGHDYRNSIRIFVVKLDPPVLEVLIPWLAFSVPQESVCLLGKEYSSLATSLCYVSLP